MTAGEPEDSDTSQTTTLVLLYLSGLSPNRSTVTLEDLEKIADTGVFLFKARFGETRFWEDIVQAAREGDENELNVARLQASIYAAQSHQ